MRVDYEEAISDYNNAGGPIVSGEYRINDVYDPDPLILSRSVQFAQYMFDIYLKAKVISATIVHTFDNLEQHALEIACFQSTQPLLSSLGSRGQIESQEASGLMIRRKVMTEQYGKQSKVTIKYTLKMGMIVGNMIQYKASEDYSCTSSSSPVIPLYTSWVVFSSLATISTGFTKRTSVSLRVLFYSPRPIPSVLVTKTHIEQKKKETEEDKEDRRAARAIRCQPEFSQGFAQWLANKEREQEELRLLWEKQQKELEERRKLLSRLNAVAKDNEEGPQ